MITFNKFLIIGATGKTGIELVKFLLKEKKQVAICVRSIKKAKNVFKGLYEEITTVVEHELGLQKESKELEEAIKWSDIVINSSAATFGGVPQISDYETNNELLNLMEKQEVKVKKYILVSSWYLTRPYGFISIGLNLLMSCTFGWKSLTENKIRQSSIPYIIVRPSALTNQSNTETSSIKITQDDQIFFGTISRANVAKSILRILESQTINIGNITLDLTESSNKKLEYFEVIKKVKVDDESDFITADHFKANKLISILFYSIAFIIFCYFIMKIKA